MDEIKNMEKYSVDVPWCMETELKKTRCGLCGVIASVRSRVARRSGVRNA